MIEIYDSQNQNIISFTVSEAAIEYMNTPAFVARAMELGWVAYHPETGLWKPCEDGLWNNFMQFAAA